MIFSILYFDDFYNTYKFTSKQFNSCLLYFTGRQLLKAELTGLSSFTESHRFNVLYPLT